MARKITAILDALATLYGELQPAAPADPDRALVWLHCGYPASDAACTRGWDSLTSAIGVEPPQILAASLPHLTAALRPGGLIPELRAQRLHQIAARMRDEFPGGLTAALTGSPAAARRILKSFPAVGDPGADRILLFAGLAPAAAVPSNSPHVLVRILHGRAEHTYASAYRAAQQALDAALPLSAAPRVRAYLLLKRHAQEFCKKTRPQCGACPVSAHCAYAAAGGK